MIAPCSCPHEYQDSVYGKGKRVQNPTKKDDLKCTVCEKRNNKPAKKS